MPTYETLYIAQPEMAEADAEALGKSFEELVATGEGTLMKSAAWGQTDRASALALARVLRATCIGASAARVNQRVANRGLDLQ